MAKASSKRVTYQIKPAAVTWTGYAEVGSYAPSGTVQLRQGHFAYDGRNPRAGRFEFDMRTLTQEQPQLAEHLRGEDFFDVAKYPTAVFVLQQVRAGQARGLLTLHGVTRPIRFPLTLEPDAQGQVHATGTATIDRTQFGINFNSSSFFQNLGSYAIRNEFRLAFDLVAVSK
ncbi:YceI family protein [Hymenobacter rubripertinctus]|uniref:YceI family protein n=1 Tax=Hymenobacter rubripertinctus TaxID=2029981 RepID=UPI0015FEC51A|nr:YceI family protein [Hymenobacter rubripertinctus]